MAEQWLPLIVSAMGILGAAALYAYQRSIDRRDKLQEKKQAAYESFLHALYNVVAELRSRPGEETAHDQFQRAKLSVFLFAPDDVVESVGSYVRLVEDSSGPPPERRIAFAKMIKAMRADTFEKSRLEDDRISTLSPISHPDGDDRIAKTLVSGRST